jgi:hypothetical protein
VNQYFQGISGTSFVSPELKTVDVCGVYFWKVRANDGTDFGSYSTQFNFSIQPLVSITLTQNFTNFGVMQIRETNDTADGNPQPFVVQSDSNVLVNITIRALDALWDTSGLGNNTFRFKANRTAERNAFNFSGSQIVYKAMKGAFQPVVKQLKFANTNDTAAIDFEVTVPAEEPSGIKTSSVVVAGAQS